MDIPTTCHRAASPVASMPEHHRAWGGRPLTRPDRAATEPDERTGAAAQATQGVAGLGALPSAGGIEAILDALRAGRSDDATRRAIHAVFGPAGLEVSNKLMQQVRDAGLLEPFIAATARQKDGTTPPPVVLDGIRRILETGRLDVYAETLASVPITVFDGDTSTEQHSLFFRPGDGIYLKDTAIADWAGEDAAATLSHEMFHAYNAAHGLDGKGAGTTGALNEGMGIAAISYAFDPGAPRNIAEMVYGTKNWYRDKNGNEGYELGDATNADPELLDLLHAMSADDASQVAWEDPARLRADYERFFEPLSRSDPRWFELAQEATESMLAAR